MMLALLLTPALAHQPIFAEDCGDAESACVVGDPDISVVVYQPVSCEVDQLWLSYFASEGFPLYVQLGVPVIERLADYAPSVAVLHPGLPAPEQALPFDLPAGYGALVFEGGDDGEFFEPFTQTESRVLVEETVVLPQDGLGYLVAWDPEGVTGKLWLATGTVEDFSDVDWAEAAGWTEQVNDFHETGRFATPPEVTETTCEMDEVNEAPVECGVGTPVGSAWLLAVLGLMRRRRS